MSGSPEIKLSMGPVEWAMLVGLSMLWGASFFFVEIVVSVLPPLTVVWLRVAMAALTLNLLLVITGQAIPKGREIWKAFFTIGFINNLIPFSLIAWGQTQINGGAASILNAATPAMAVLVAHFLTNDEKLTPGRMGGVMLGFLGVGLMIGFDAFRGAGANVLAQLAVVGASLSYGFAGVFGRRFRRMEISPLQTAAGQLSASSVLLLPLMLLVDQPWSISNPVPEVWFAMCGLAVLSTALAYILYFRILGTSGATNVLLVTFLVPVSAIWMGWMFLGELLVARQFMAMALIAGGILVLDGRFPRFLRVVVLRGA